MTPLVVPNITSQANNIFPTEIGGVRIDAKTGNDPTQGDRIVNETNEIAAALETESFSIISICLDGCLDGEWRDDAHDVILIEAFETLFDPLFSGTELSSQHDSTADCRPVLYEYK